MGKRGTVLGWLRAARQRATPTIHYQALPSLRRPSSVSIPVSLPRVVASEHHADIFRLDATETGPSTQRYLEHAVW